MSTMASVLDKELGSYLKQLNEAEKKSVLLMLKTFLLGRNDDAGRISIEQYNREIDEALAEVAAGNYITQEEMEKRAAKW
jgi:predicted transcriptional regulator